MNLLPLDQMAHSHCALMDTEYKMVIPQRLNFILGNITMPTLQLNCYKYSLVLYCINM